ncbi:hypothetical protein B7494_g6387 [Chlorociboria aeruginascens]|nr:hypothetical protein B7494_g6387 [Chlorociboria aeruginascens]
MASKELEPPVVESNNGSARTPSLGKTSLEAATVEETVPPGFPEGGARAWAVAAGAAGAMMMAMMMMMIMLIYRRIYQEYYQTHQLRDQSPSNISWIGSLQTFFLLGGGIFGGPLFDKYGEKVLWGPSMLYVFAVMMTSICKSYWQFMLAQGVLGGVCSGLMITPAMAATSQYFLKRRGAAMGLVIAGSSIGGVIFPIALSRMFNNPSLGFGWSVRICGFVMLAVLLLSLVAIKARLPPRIDQFFILSAFKNPVYVLTIIAEFLTIMGIFAPLFYLPTFAVHNGMDTQLASYILSITNGASFFGRVIPGITADRVGRFNMLFMASVCSGVLILCWQKIHTNASIIVFAALFGYCSGSVVSLMSVCFAQIPENPKDIGTYMGMALAIISLGSLIGPPIDGVLVNKYGGFDQVSIFCGVLTLAGSAFVALAKFRRGFLGHLSFEVQSYKISKTFEAVFQEKSAEEEPE